MLIQFTKQAGGGATLCCRRADGSTTWQRRQGRQASFFPMHDLTHFAVEIELGFSHGFYGLLAAGWSIDDTTGKGGRGPLPAEALTVEYIVGALDAERSAGVAWTAAEFNAHARTFAAGSGRPAPRELTGDELDRVRVRAAALQGRWAALPPGATLELRFEPQLRPSAKSVH
jgi:hypothetical protein